MSNRMGVRYRLLGALALLLSAGCSDSTGPDPVNIAGTWLYSAAGLTGGPGTGCAVAALVTITQNGGTFAGTYSGRGLSCYRDGQPVEIWLPSEGVVVNGYIDGDDLMFDVVDGWFHHDGTVGPSQISGMAALVIAPDMVVQGQFFAVRQ